MGSDFLKRVRLVSAAAAATLIFSSVYALRADEPAPAAVPQLTIEHADCTLFGPQRENYAQQARDRYSLSAATEQVTRMLAPAPRAVANASLPPAPGGSRTGGNSQLESGNLIDQYIFSALRDAGVTPAEKTNDFEFIRRTTLDLTGRIPTPDRVLSFVNDGSPDKRSKLVDELLAKPEWVDKWTMYFGDKYKNTTNKTAVRMYDDGRNAFYEWIKASLAANKPYDQMAREVIGAQGTNSYDPAQGPINWTVGQIVTGGPQQDIWDSQTAAIAETFLGMAHVNCLLCHDGRRHLDSLTLWGGQSTRYQAWQLAAFMSHSNEVNTRTDPATPNSPYYWSIQDNVKYKTDYALNTTTGNRPARQPVSPEKVVAPMYIFSGAKAGSSGNLRQMLATNVTGDFQFARATVNYIWKEFFGRGIVDPVNQFDPARLDPDNPPPDPWTLQPSNPRLLTALAQDFVKNGYDIKYLMKLISTSEAYQLSSRYNGQWNPLWEPLFARKLVRRLWGEEVMDALAQSSGIVPTYTVNTYKFNWAMQAPEPRTILNNVLNAFMPGNRDDQDRKSDGAVQQGLAMMNDALIMNRTRSSGSGATASLLSKALPGSNDQLIQTLYLNVLSRYPTDAEKSTALAALSSGTRQQKAEDLLWSLYNKVDFLFNY
jgi:hypothetical protein